MTKAAAVLTSPGELPWACRDSPSGELIGLFGHLDQLGIGSEVGLGRSGENQRPRSWRAPIEERPVQHGDHVARPGDRSGQSRREEARSLSRMCLVDAGFGPGGSTWLLSGRGAGAGDRDNKSPTRKIVLPLRASESMKLLTRNRSCFRTARIGRIFWPLEGALSFIAVHSGTSPGLPVSAGPRRTSWLLVSDDLASGRHRDLGHSRWPKPYTGHVVVLS